MPRYNTKPYETDLPESLKIDDICTGFLALDEPTRLQVLRQFQEAQRDTSVEYHRFDPKGEIARSLYQEVLILNAMIVALMKACNILGASHEGNIDHREQERNDQSESDDGIEHRDGKPGGSYTGL